MRGFDSRLISIFTGAFLLLCLPLGAQTPVDVEMSATGISFQTKANFERMVLTISGPENTILKQEFEPGASLFFGLEADLPDGSYTYELHLVPAVSDDLRDKMARLREHDGTAGITTKGAVASGHFTIKDSQIVADRDEAIQTKDQQILDDLIVDGSACIGFDCVNGESFGFDTLRLKENNLRIKFQDTSSSASFPTNDWQITANDSSNGGANKFSIDDIDGGRTPFTIEASAPSHSLYVDDGGRLGLGTSTPVVDVHVKSGNTPTLRLEQDGTNGFTPQTWDVAGNEAGFFVRDATNGSTLPLRIRPGAPSSAIDIAADGDVGIGTSSPTNPVHVRRTNGTARVFVEDTQTTGNTQLLRLEAGGRPRLTMVNNTAVQTWHQEITNSNEFQWIEATTSNLARMTLESTGNLIVTGTVTATVGGTNIVFPDYVFAPDYDLMPLEALEAFVKTNKHLPSIPKAETVAEEGLNMTEIQIKLVEKVEELTLYTIEQHKTIAALQARLEALENAENTVTN